VKIKGGRSGHVKVHLDEPEAALLRSLVSEMQTLLEADVPDEDEVKARLFPRAYETDDDERGFRDLTASDLETAKLETLREVRDALGVSGAATVDLGPDEVGSWLRLLTDLRLAIGVRLDVTEETMASELDADDPNAPALSVLHWLGWLQGSILERIGG
jgi:hypothetical protein